MIQARNLTKSYGNRKVLRGLSLNVASGEIVSLIGSNGAGKTTLLRILANLTRADAGSVILEAFSVRDQPEPYRRQLGVVLHAPMLYGNLSARENLRFFSRLYQMDNSEERVEFLLERVNLRSRADDLVRTYSRGMQQRLAIARALLHDPSCLLLDEPYTGLDPDSARIFETLVLESAAGGKTILLATHDLENACRISTRIDLLHQGKIAFTRPRNDLTASELNRLYHDVTNRPDVKPLEQSAQ